MNGGTVRYVVVGNGRLGRAMAAALAAAGATVEGPVTRKGRISTGAGEAVTTVVLLCVPERQIGLVAHRDDIPANAVLGHCSASAAMDLMAPYDRFFTHPLMTFTGRETDGSKSPFHGVTCAYDGRGERALPAAEALVATLGMRPVRMPPDQRKLYHAAASIASNFLVTLEGVAERLAGECGVNRSMLAPLVRSTVENWVATGFRGAITGPIARGDEVVVDDQRGALARSAPDVLPLFDAMERLTLAALGRPRREDDPLRFEVATRGLDVQIVRTVAGLRAAVEHARSEGRWIGFVPTMGALHEGHLSLLRRAHRDGCFTVASVFVNPTQFNDPRDLEAYPRDLAADAEVAYAAGADVVFAPDVEEVYPEGFATTVEVMGLTEPLEGVARGTEHFRGVATIVTKLFNLVRPDVAYFGQKDAQQALVIKRLAADLDFPLRIEVCPTVREADGLAMSSRNVRLPPDARARATGLSACLFAMQREASAGERSAAALLATGQSVLDERGIIPADVEYLAVVDAETLESLEEVAPGRAALVAIAARVGGVRLIDNVVVVP